MSGHLMTCNLNTQAFLAYKWKTLSVLVWLEHLIREQKVLGSNPDPDMTDLKKDLFALVS